jgi:hypothetical protein
MVRARTRSRPCPAFWANSGRRHAGIKSLDEETGRTRRRARGRWTFPVSPTGAAGLIVQLAAGEKREGRVHHVRRRRPIRVPATGSGSACIHAVIMI